MFLAIAFTAKLTEPVIEISKLVFIFLVTYLLKYRQIISKKILKNKKGK